MTTGANGTTASFSPKGDREGSRGLGGSSSGDSGSYRPERPHCLTVSCLKASLVFKLLSVAQILKSLMLSEFLSINYKNKYKTNWWDHPTTKKSRYSIK